MNNFPIEAIFQAESPNSLKIFLQIPNFNNSNSKEIFDFIISIIFGIKINNFPIKNSNMKNIALNSQKLLLLEELEITQDMNNIKIFFNLDYTFSLILTHISKNINEINYKTINNHDLEAIICNNMDNLKKFTIVIKARIL